MGWLLAALLCLPGCSMVKVTYNQADHIAAWIADDYFDLKPAQKEMFRERFQRFQAWHRSEQLPLYAKQLAEAKRRFEAGVTREDVLWVSDTLKADYRALVNHSVEDMAAVLATLGDEQIDALRDHFRKVNREFAKENHLDGTPEDRRRRRAERLIDRLDHWTGRLSAEQQRQITALSEATPLIGRLREADRMRRQREFVQLLARRGEGAEFVARLRHWLLNWEEGRAPEYDKLLDELVEKNVEMYLAIDRMLNADQRARVARRLQNYRDDALELAQQQVRASAAAQ